MLTVSVGSDELDFAHSCSTYVYVYYSPLEWSSISFFKFLQPLSSFPPI